MSSEEAEKRQVDAELARRELLPRHAAWDKTAFADFMELYRAPVYSYLVRSGVEPASRDDLFQEVFLRVHVAAGTYRPQMPVEPWLFRIVANAVRSHFRKVKVRGIVQSQAVPPEQVHATHAGDLAEAADTAQFLESEIAKLSEAQREAVLLCCIKELGHRDVSQILGIPENTLKTNLSRARIALAKALARRNATIMREAAV